MNVAGGQRMLGMAWLMIGAWLGFTAARSIVRATGYWDVRESFLPFLFPSIYLAVAAGICLTGVLLAVRGARPRLAMIAVAVVLLLEGLLSVVGTTYFYLHLDLYQRRDPRPTWLSEAGTALWSVLMVLLGAWSLRVAFSRRPRKAATRGKST
ncbi:MAG: hypothetical protein HY680_06965 [Chloroflexi bacterium]|nr:hypothetical protein [Chloroflexota bacterium]